jgi:hypothetical protein
MMDHAFDDHALPPARRGVVGRMGRQTMFPLSGALLAAAIAVWAISLGSIDLRDISDAGLVTALPATFFAALLLLIASFVIALMHRIVPLLTVQLGTLILVLFGTASLIEHGPRTQTAWRIAGIVDYVRDTHSIDRGIDAFFNWPGFFILLAFITSAAGLPDSLGLAEWAPVFFNLAYLVPLLVIFRALAVSDRQVWLGLWLFVSANWVGQDYLAPQAFGYLLYLVILAVLVSVFRTSAKSAAEEHPPREQSPRARMLAIAIVLLLFAAIVPSHQLTPWMVILSVTALVAVRRLPSFGLPLVMAVITLAWVVFFTGPFLTGHFGDVARPIGSVAGNIDASVGGRFEGSLGHLMVLRIRIGFSLAVGLLAAWGLLRLYRGGAQVRTIAALALVPFVTLAFQSYGGELMLRVYFFSLPFLALAAAAGLEPLFASKGWLRLLGATALLLVVALGLVTSRYGNEKADFFTQGEVAAVEYIYASAPRDSLVAAAYDNVPWRFDRYADYRREVLDRSAVTEASIPRILDELRGPEPSYVLLSRSQDAAGTLLGGWKPGTLARLRAELIRSGHFRVVFSNDDATVLKLRSDRQGSDV